MSRPQEDSTPPSRIYFGEPFNWKEYFYHSGMVGAIAESKSLSPNARLLLIWLLDKFNAKMDGIAWPKIDTIAEALGKGRRTIDRNLAELERQRYIRIESGVSRSRGPDGAFRANNYQLLLREEYLELDQIEPCVRYGARVSKRDSKRESTGTAPGQHRAPDMTEPCAISDSHRAPDVAHKLSDSEHPDVELSDEERALARSPRAREGFPPLDFLGPPTDEEQELYLDRLEEDDDPRHDFLPDDHFRGLDTGMSRSMAWEEFEREQAKERQRVGQERGGIVRQHGSSSLVTDSSPSSGGEKTRNKTRAALAVRAGVSPYRIQQPSSNEGLEPQPPPPPTPLIKAPDPFKASSPEGDELLSALRSQFEPHLITSDWWATIDRLPAPVLHGAAEWIKTDWQAAHYGEPRSLVERAVEVARRRLPPEARAEREAAA